MSSSVNAYASLSDLKAVLGITSTTDDTIMRKILESASRSIETYCNRVFYSFTATKYFDGDYELWLPDLLSVTTLKTDEDGDGTYENTLADTDYILYGVGIEDTLNTYPKIRLEINPNGNYGSFASGVKKGVQIAGVWGYGDGTSATPYVTDTTLNEAVVVGETAIDVTSATNLSAGMTILVGTEQMYITSVSTNTLTVEKGVNGTTDAAHDNASQVYFYRYPADVRQCCIDLSSALYSNRDKQGLQSVRMGDFAYNKTSPLSESGKVKSTILSILDDELFSYKRLRF